MDNNAIDQILSAVNGTYDDNENLAVIMRDLPHRAPQLHSINTSHTNSNDVSKLRVKKPSDPIQSVPSVDIISDESADLSCVGSQDRNCVGSQDRNCVGSQDRNCVGSQDRNYIRSSPFDSKEKHNEVNNISNRRDRMRERDQNNENNHHTFNKDDSHHTINKDDKQNIHSSNKSDDKDNILITQSSHLTNIMGYNIPTATIYFIIVLIVIAVGLYFLTAEKKNSIKNDNERHKRKDDPLSKDPQNDE